MGDDQFWLESGNDWADQLRQYQNVRKMKEITNEQWFQRGITRIEEDKKHKEQARDENRFPTNNPNLMPEAERDTYREEVQRRLGIGKSHRSQAEDIVSKLFHYIPGSKSIITADLA